MTTDTHQWLERYERVRRKVEISAWVLGFLFSTLAEGIVWWIDTGRFRGHFEGWEPFVWEATSHLMWLALIPLMLAFEHRVPLGLFVPRRNFLWHALATVVVSALHVAGMVALRKAAYAFAGQTYHFGDWRLQFFYEYLKDQRSYILIFVIVGAYRLLLRRLHGEAALLAAPDVGPETEPVERPERFLVKKLGKEFLLPADDIEWLQAWGNYVNLRVRGRDYPLRTTLASVETRLDPTRFVRTHRSYIVNLAFVEAIEPLENGEAKVLVKGGAMVPCSRRHREQLRLQSGYLPTSKSSSMDSSPAS